MSHEATTTGSKPLLTPFNVIAAIILINGAVVTFLRFTQGLGPVTNLSDYNPWGIWIGFDLLVGVALAAGGFVTSADLHHFDIGIEPGVPSGVDNPLGRFAAVPAGDDLVIRQTFTRPTGAAARWFVFTRGRLEALAVSSPAAPAGPGTF